jgi:uncharacterized membrane protein (DUF4010 family)
VNGQIPDLAATFQLLAISLGLGLLVGIQRERVDAPLAGIRTFPLITLFGTVTGLLALQLGGWVVAIGLLAVALAAGIGNVMTLKLPRPDIGITTDISILLMYALGAYLVYGHRVAAVVLGAGVAVLLHIKPVLHRFVERLGENDMRAMMQFVVISLVILPVLPDRPYGPFGVLNPREIWWFVVLVVGISLAGYVVLKLYSGGKGLVLTGLIGGLVSSTATTASQARRASAQHAQAATVVVLLASTVVYVRVLTEIGVAGPSIFGHVALPLALMLGVAALLCVILLRRTRHGEAELPAPQNPTELRSALFFGAIYAVVLLAVAAARQYLGERGVYVAAALSGLTDLDAITLSTSRLGEHGALRAEVVWRSIVIAIIANLAFKTGLVAMLGGRTFARQVGAWFGIQAAVGLALIVLWPA